MDSDTSLDEHEYEVELYAQVWATVTVVASSEDEAGHIALREVDEYEVDFEVRSVWQTGP